MGADLLTGIRNWEDGYRLVKDFKFILVDRPNYKME
jgi:nicotinic acid mononucleotide adenylyltransferase